MKKGDKVRFTGGTMHDLVPDYYPPVGTVGVVVEALRSGNMLVQWPLGSTKGDARWYAELIDLTPAEEGEPDGQA